MSDPSVKQIAEVVARYMVEVDLLVDEARQRAEHRLGVPAGDFAVLDDAGYAEVLDLYGQLRRVAVLAHTPEGER